MQRISFMSIIMLLLIPLSISAQKTFPGKSVDILAGKELKVDDTSNYFKSYGYPDFFLDREMKKVFCPPSDIDAIPVSTEYNCIYNTTFKVDSIFGYTDSLLNVELYIIKLIRSNPTNDTCYYRYDPRYEKLWPFTVTTQVQLPHDFYCRRFTITKDDFTGDEVYQSPASFGISLKMERKVKDTPVFYLKFSQPLPSSFSGEKKGVFLMVSKGGLNIARPDVVVETTPSGAFMIASVTIKLTKEELLSLRDYTISKLKIAGIVIPGELNSDLSKYIECFYPKLTL